MDERRADCCDARARATARWRTPSARARAGGRGSCGSAARAAQQPRVPHARGAL